MNGRKFKSQLRKAMTPKAIDWLSDCHNVPVKVVGGDEGTNHWECTECNKSCNAHQPDNTIDSEVEKILVEMSVDIIDPLASDLEPTQEAIKKIKNLIAQEANKARINELKQLEPPEQCEEYAKLMGSEQCNICGFNALEFRRHIQERIKALTADKEQADENN